MLSTDLIISSAPPERTGSAAALSETGGELGAALGIATFGTIGTAVYSSQITDRMPGGVPEAVSDSFAGAFATAQHLPALISAAKDAFLAGMNVVTAISAAVLVGIAVLVLVLLRDVPRLGQEPDPEYPVGGEPASAQRPPP